MKERIQYLISQNKMTAAQFADHVGIQRSTLSHILNGRNKPGVDIIMKIHEAYPDVSVNWLMFGEGDMKPETDEFVSGSGSEEKQTATPGNEDTENVAHVSGMVNESRGTYKTRVIPYSAHDEKPFRKIQKIMVFYTDNTFETFSAD